MNLFLKIQLPMLLLFPLLLQAQKGSITGQVVSTKDKSVLIGAVVAIRSLNMQTFTNDANGFYRLDSLLPGEYELTAYYVNFPTKTVKCTVYADSVSKLIIDMYVYCKYDAHRKNSKCPQCKSRKHVVPIVYGLPIGEMDTDKYYYAGCEVSYCDPHWYCKKDKLKF